MLPALLLLLAGAAQAGTQARPDTDTRELLRSTLSKLHHFQDRYDAEVWLVDMAGRLERRAPAIAAAERMEILRQVHKTATEFNLNPQLVLSLIEIESNFDKFAISSAGARGLMQVMPFWREEIGVRGDNLFDIGTNIRYGCAILSIYLDREQRRLAPALARYNGSYGDGAYPTRVLNAFYGRWFLRGEGNLARTASNQPGSGVTGSLQSTRRR